MRFHRYSRMTKRAENDAQVYIYVYMPNINHSISILKLVQLEPGHISYSQAQPVTDVPPVVQVIPSKK